MERNLTDNLEARVGRKASALRRRAAARGFYTPDDVAGLERLCRDRAVRSELVGRLGDENWQVRAAAAKALSGVVRNPEVQGALLELLNDNQPYVRATAAETLAGAASDCVCQNPRRGWEQTICCNFEQETDVLMVARRRRVGDRRRKDGERCRADGKTPHRQSPPDSSRSGVVPVGRRAVCFRRRRFGPRDYNVLGHQVIKRLTSHNSHSQVRSAVFGPAANRIHCHMSP